MSGAYKYRPQHTQNTLGPDSGGTKMDRVTKTHQKSIDVIASIKAQGRGREVKVPRPDNRDRLPELLERLQATTVEAAIEQLDHHFGKDAKIIEMLLERLRAPSPAEATPAQAEHDFNLWPHSHSTEHCSACSRELIGQPSLNSAEATRREGELQRALNRCLDSLGPDRSASDRRDTLMTLRYLHKSQIGLAPPATEDK